MLMSSNFLITPIISTTFDRPRIINCPPEIFRLKIKFGEMDISDSPVHIFFCPYLLKKFYVNDIDIFHDTPKK